MKTQSIKIFTLFLAIILFIPYVGLAECGESSAIESQSTNDMSQLTSDELYELYVDNVLGNNPYIHQMNHNGNNYESLSNELFLLESDFIDLDLYVLAQEESRILFNEWIKDEEGRKDFLARVNENIEKESIVENYQFANNVNK
jgi:hypothetical protein